MHDEHVKVWKKREKNRAKCANYSRKNREKINLWQRENYKKNRKSILAKQKVWASQNPDKVRDKQKRYQKKHPEKMRAHWLKKYKRRLKRDAYFRATRSLRSRIRSFFRGRTKSVSAMVLLGTTPVKLRARLEAQFKPGMSWDNYGYYGWHIDHIKPCASFDLSDPEQQKQCFHYTNLQPLWAKENYDKSDKILTRSSATEARLANPEKEAGSTPASATTFNQGGNRFGAQ